MVQLDLTAVELSWTIITETDAEKAKVLQDGLNIKYQEKLCIYMEREKTLTDGLNQAYSFIFQNYYIKTMQQRIEENTDF